MSAEHHHEASVTSQSWEVVVVPTEVSVPVELIGRDAERLRVQVVNTGANLVVINASREALGGDGQGFVLPPGGSLALDTTAPIWGMSVASPAGGGPSEMSLLVERRRP